MAQFCLHKKGKIWIHLNSVKDAKLQNYDLGFEEICFFCVGTPAYAMATTLRKRMIIIFQPGLFLIQINLRLTCWCEQKIMDYIVRTTWAKDAQKENRVTSWLNLASLYCGSPHVEARCQAKCLHLLTLPFGSRQLRKQIDLFKLTNWSALNTGPPGLSLSQLRRIKSTCVAKTVPLKNTPQRWHICAIAIFFGQFVDDSYSHIVSRFYMKQIKNDLWHLQFKGPKGCIRISSSASVHHHQWVIIITSALVHQHQCISTSTSASVHQLQCISVSRMDQVKIPKVKQSLR